MLQKYHPNPLSHFLALHNSQATHHNVVDAHTLASTLANGHVQFQQQQQHYHQQQQQQQPLLPSSALLANHHNPQNTHNQTALELAAQHLTSHNSPTHAIQRDHHSPLNNHQLFQHHHHHQQQQQQQQQQRNLQHHNQHQSHHHHHAQQLIEAAAAANTTLDAGKSFTIAAILGLQKSAMENTRKEYTNSVINLSINSASHHQHHHHQNSNIQQQQTPTNSTTPPLNDENEQQQHHLDSNSHQHHPQKHIQNQRDALNNNSNNNNNGTNNNNNNDNNDHNNSSSNNNNNSSNNNNRDVSKSNICNSFNASLTAINNTNGNGNSSNSSSINNPVNSFNCDNTTSSAAASAATVLMNRYLPSAMVNVTGTSVVASTPSLASFASSPVMAHQQHARVNSFVAAAAAAAAAAAGANGGPSALQSLQQLHQQHAHQTSLSFQREKLKSDHNGKKSSLKNKRVRTIFTPEQLERLEAEFERQQYMVGPERLYLAHTLSLTEAQVKVWFQNRRIKWRKHHLEMTQQRLALLRQTQITTNPNGNSETATINIDTNGDDCDDIKREELRELNESRQDTESELSICNDSMDAESIIDGDDET